MAWQTVFGIANVWAMIWWAGLILAPRWAALLSGVLFAGIGLLCLAYAILLGLIVSGTVDPVGASGGADFTTISGVQAIFGPGTNLIKAAEDVLRLLGHNMPPQEDAA